MNFEKLFDLQKELDSRIVNTHNLQEESLLSRKILALQVEIGELANETRCFKYWSNKLPSPKEVILEEYVDCIHFILSIGIEKNFCDININIDKLKNEITDKLTDQFISIYIDINDFVVCPSIDHYTTLFEDFIILGLSLNFNEEDIEKAYFDKNIINHERQDNGY